MSFLLPALAIAGAGISAVGSIESGLYAGQVAKNNSTIATQNANYAREAGSEQATAQSIKGAAEGARIKTAQAANGVDVNSGSAVDVQEGQRETSRLDAETVLNNADLSAYGYTTQANNFDAQSQQDVAGGIFDAAGTLLGSASSIGGKWNTPVSSGVGTTGELSGYGAST